MFVLCMLWMILVLGGAAASLWFSGALHDLWLRVARAPALVRCPVWQQCSREGFCHAVGGGDAPPLRIRTRSGSPPDGLPPKR